MGDAQSWVLIGGFLAITSAMVGLVLRTVGSTIDAVRIEFGRVEGIMRAELGALGSDVRLVEGTMRAELGALGSDVRRVEGVVTQRLDSLDRDVQALTERFYRP